MRDFTQLDALINAMHAANDALIAAQQAANAAIVSARKTAEDAEAQCSVCNTALVQASLAVSREQDRLASVK